MNKFAIEFKWGVIFTIVSLLWMMLEKAAGLHDEHIDRHAIYTNLFAIPAIAVYVFALREKKRKYYNGNMTWTQGFLAGVIVSLVVTLFSPLAQYITFTVISPDFFENSIKHAVAAKALSLSAAKAYFTLDSYIAYGMIGGISMGVVTSAIVALFVKSKKLNG